VRAEGSIQPGTRKMPGRDLLKKLVISRVPLAILNPCVFFFGGAFKAVLTVEIQNAHLAKAVFFSEV